jgi:hypothetical protein
MADPTLLIAAPKGLQTLVAGSYTEDELGLCRAEVTFVCYPTDPSLYPRKGARHPLYPALQLSELEVKVDTFAFITGVYFGVLRPTYELEDENSSWEMVSPNVWGKTAQGHEYLAQSAKFQRRVTRVKRGISSSPRSAGGAGYTVTNVQKGPVWQYTEEYTSIWEYGGEVYTPGGVAIIAP